MSFSIHFSSLFSLPIHLLSPSSIYLHNHLSIDLLHHLTKWFICFLYHLSIFTNCILRHLFFVSIIYRPSSSSVYRLSFVYLSCYLFTFSIACLTSSPSLYLLNRLIAFSIIYRIFSTICLSSPSTNFILYHSSYLLRHLSIFSFIFLPPPTTFSITIPFFPAISIIWSTLSRTYITSPTCLLQQLSSPTSIFSNVHLLQHPSSPTFIFSSLAISDVLVRNTNKKKKYPTKFPFSPTIFGISNTNFIFLEITRDKIVIFSANWYHKHTNFKV